MCSVEAFISDVNIMRTVRLVYCDEKCRFDALSDFERFAFICESAELFIGNKALDLLSAAICADCGERFCFTFERKLEREETKALWQRIFAPDALVRRECVPAAENTSESKRLLDEKCAELYRLSKEKTPNCLSVEERLLSLKHSNSAFPKDTEAMAEMLAKECNISGAKWLSIDLRNREYIRPDAYHAEQIYNSLVSDENYKNTNKNEMLTLSVWLLCRAMMKSELSPCIYINNSQELKIMTDLLTRLKLARKMTLCVDPKRLDSRFQHEIAALAADYPQSIRIRLLCDGMTEQDFVRSTHTILHTLPIGMFW